MVAPVTTPPADSLSQLAGCSWRGIGFPALLIGTKGGHALAHHRRVDRNGARVEDLGLDGYTFHFKAPFINTISKGRNEAWAPGALFPDAYLKMIAALEDRSTGAFVHPIYGQRMCKVGPFEDTLDPDFRGGPVLVVTLFETIVDDDAAALGSTSFLSIAATAAQSLDDAFDNMTPFPATGTPGGMSLSEFVGSLSKVADQVDLFTKQVAGQIGSVVNAMTTLGEKFSAIPGFSDNTHRLVSSLHNVQQNALAKDRAVSLYVVKAPSTLASIARRVGATMPDLLTLNPGLAAGPVVQPNTIVRHYA